MSKLAQTSSHVPTTAGWVEGTLPFHHEREEGADQIDSSSLSGFPPIILPGLMAQSMQQETALLKGTGVSAAFSPLYLQLAHKLAETIHADWFETEQVLTVANVLTTVNHFLEQGRMEVAPVLDQSLSQLHSFSEIIKAKGYTPSSQWLSRVRTLPSTEEVVKLGLSPSDEVCRLKRKRLADDTVMAIEFSTLPACYLPEPTQVKDSLYAYLEDIGHAVVHVRQHVHAINASAELAGLAGIPVGEAMLKMSRIGFDAENNVIELTDTYCKNDCYDFFVELSR